MSNGGALTQDIITDILYRLPVKSLCRFKCVSPSWNTLISSPHFAKTHLNRTKTQNPKHFDNNIILICSDHNLYSVNLTADVPIATKLDLPSLQPSENKWVEVLSCNGLLLLSDNGNSNLMLLNPSTRECKKLSTPPYSVLDLVDGSDLYAFGVGYDSYRDDYKIVMVSKDNIGSSAQNDTSIVVVYSLKTDDWRRIQDIHYAPTPLTRSRVFLNGCLHCFCERNVYEVIVAFDLSDEIFREVPLPASFRFYELVFYKLAVLAGCLCLFDCQDSRIVVWMMKEYGVRESWTKFTIDPGMSRVDLLGLLTEDKFLLRTNVHRQEKLVVYASKKGTLRDVVVCGIPHLNKFGGTYVESLVSPHHKGGIWRQ